MIGPNPTDRGKLGTKPHVLADKKGVPLSVYCHHTAANTHDIKAAKETLDRIVTKRPPLNKKKQQQQQQNLGLDKQRIQLSRDRT